MEKNYQFVIVTQNWDSKSNGISILYKLSDYIEKCGFKCWIYIYNVPYGKSDEPINYKKRVIDKIDYNNDALIVILPDALPYEISRKIKSRNRVWYLLNKPMVLTKEPIHINKNDVFVAYSNLISEIETQFFLNNQIPYIDEIIPKIFNCEIKKKNQIAIYSGKARKISYLKILLYKLIYGVRIVPITRDLPKNKKTLLNILAESKILISYDPLTNIIYESILCRTPVFVADNYLRIKYKKYNIPLLGVFEKKELLKKYFFRGINENQYKYIVDSYSTSINNHINTTETFIQYVISEFNKPYGCREKDNLLKQKFFEFEFNQSKLKGNLFNSNLTNYAAIFDFKTVLRIIRLGVINNTIKIICNIMVVPQTIKKDLRREIVKHKNLIISDFINKH